jgi:hypothetical protein
MQLSRVLVGADAAAHNLTEGSQVRLAVVRHMHADAQYPNASPSLRPTPQVDGLLAGEVPPVTHLWFGNSALGGGGMYMYSPQQVELTGASFIANVAGTSVQLLDRTQ